MHRSRIIQISLFLFGCRYVASNESSDGFRATDVYTKYPYTNCWNGHGGIIIDNSTTAPEGLDASQCQARCDADAACHCIVLEQFYGKCFKRALCDINYCEHSEYQTKVYDTYTKPGGVTPPPSPIPPELPIPRHSVSGFSAGASMAISHLVSHSSVVDGMGIIGGFV